MNLFGWKDPDKGDKPVRKNDKLRRRLAKKAKRLRGQRRRAERRQEQGDDGGRFEDWQYELLKLHSEARPKNYRLNAKLCQSAQRKAEKMNRENNLSHGSDWYKMIEATGYRGAMGENIAEGFSSLVTLMKAWLNSPKHRANVMNNDFEDIGFGKSDDFYCTHFGG